MTCIQTSTCCLEFVPQFQSCEFTSCECERSGSVLKRLHTFLRAAMEQTRLSALALLHVNYDANIDIEKVIYIFARKKEFANICDINE